MCVQRGMAATSALVVSTEEEQHPVSADGRGEWQAGRWQIGSRVFSFLLLFFVFFLGSGDFDVP